MSMDYDVVIERQGAARGFLFIAAIFGIAVAWLLFIYAEMDWIARGPRISVAEAGYTQVLLLQSLVVCVLSIGLGLIAQATKRRFYQRVALSQTEVEQQPEEIFVGD